MQYAIFEFNMIEMYLMWRKFEGDYAMFSLANVNNKQARPIHYWNVKIEAE
jgi:hypothetical protein